jgi:hypothetical protein
MKNYCEKEWGRFRCTGGDNKQDCEYYAPDISPDLCGYETVYQGGTSSSYIHMCNNPEAWQNCRVRYEEDNLTPDPSPMGEGSGL